MSETLAGAVDRFLTHKRSLGRKYVSEQAALRLLVRYTATRHVDRLDQLTAAVLDDFFASRARPHPRSFNHLLGVVRGLLDWAVTYELLPASPLQTRPRRGATARIPFVFDVTAAGRLLEAAAALPDNPGATQRGPTYRAVFALCYGLGLRAGEVCGLRLGDVDSHRRLLVVHGGKFGKTRLVPHGPRIAEVIDAQLARRRADGARGEDAPLFSFDGQRPIHPGTASQVFHQLVTELDFPVPDGVSPPRLHDLRHSFAIGCLLRWYREGLDPSTRLQHLATFMGHVDPTSTAVYLTVTPALLAEANRRFEAFTDPIRQEPAR